LSVSILGKHKKEAADLSILPFHGSRAALIVNAIFDIARVTLTTPVEDAEMGSGGHGGTGTPPHPIIRLYSLLVNSPRV
jgi:hypothetical protein